MAWNEPGGNGDNKDPWGSGNNNRGGNKGGGDQGPPDLDEALRKLQDKLSGIFGGSGKNNAGNGGGSSTSSGGAGLFWIIALIAIVIWAGMGVYTVDQQERGVVLRLGKYNDTVGPGLQWNPPLIDLVEKVNVTRVRTRDHRALMLTKDENIVDVEMTVQYVITDAKGFVLTVRDPEASLSNAAESALRHVVGSTNMHSILTQGREQLSIQVQERLQGYMTDYGTGLRISKVNIKEAKAPNQVQDAFDDVIKAREDEQRVKNEAESYANGIIPEARGQAQRVLEEASAYKEQVVARSEGDAKRFTALLTEYEKAPDVTRERLYLDTMQEVLAANPKVLVDVEGGNNMMYLPLDKIMQNRPVSADANSPVRLDSQSLREVTDQVVDELRIRQSTRREGR
ncbi:FtsH protease activity modulator HflK [Neptuniibacter sp. 1_MG-2023]|jgi:membrane protease subunit HflK|uniref:FtsH protease activity modulator HflK n=1 Tax=Neptuniibacter sp. 1_MG-2023 TaxID=3062662 RepID=UPI0026E142FF|nr:FtsH protease activity modulator HflK [Neptuniibacter sp. 1_MG-2023]MDO6594836.1 FtsH protease activity modulator HflK [Neptuniibacter sp. 1_MG-2023]